MEIKNIEKIVNFRMPRYNELPNIGLYIDQVLAYMDEIFRDLGITEENKLLTSSMVNNYVKQSVVPATIKKRYYREHLAYLVIVCLSKQVFTIEETSRMIKIQKSVYDIETAYNYICVELEKILEAVFMEKPLPQDSSKTLKPQRYFVRNTLISVVHKIYIQHTIGLFLPQSEETEE